jgi:hypothetical protein
MLALDILTCLLLLLTHGLSTAIVDHFGIDPMFPNLVLWLSPNNSVYNAKNAFVHDGGLVARWVNRAAANPNAAVSQSVAAQQPRLIRAGVNRLPVLRFNASRQGLANGLLSLAPVRTMIGVFCDVGSPASIATPLSTSSSDGQDFNSVGVYVIAGNRYAFFDWKYSGISGPISISNRWVIGIYTYGPTAVSITINGAADGSVSGTHGIVSTGFCVSYRCDSTTRHFVGDIGDLMVYDKVLSPLELNQLGFFLSQQYAISSSFLNPGNVPHTHPHLFT